MRRSEASPKRTNFDKHSCWMERTLRSVMQTKHGLRYREQGDLLQRPASEPLSDRGQRRSLRIGQSESGWQMRAKDPILCNQIREHRNQNISS